jgi:hypothetical protein
MRKSGVRFSLAPNLTRLSSSDRRTAGGPSQDTAGTKGTSTSSTFTSAGAQKCRTPRLPGVVASGLRRCVRFGG